jgi:hypothetical protein
VAILATELAVDTLGLIAAVLVALFSYRVAVITGKRRYNYFALAFLLISVSCATLAWFAYNGVSVTSLLPVDAEPTGALVALAGALLLTLVGYLVMFLMLERVDNWPVVIVLFISIVTALLMADHLLMAYFWLSFVILGMVAIRFFMKYQEARSKTALLIALAFGFLFLGSIADLFTPHSNNYFIAGSIARIIGYLLLAGSMFSIYSVGESPRSKATYRMRDIS